MGVFQLAVPFDGSFLPKFVSLGEGNRCVMKRRSGGRLEYFNSSKMVATRLTGFSRTLHTLLQDFRLICLLSFPSDTVRYSLLALWRIS